MADWLSGLGKLGGQLVQGATDWIGNEKASNRLRGGVNAARQDLSQGYGQGMGFQQPIYDTGMGVFKGVANKYNEGGFSAPTMSPYKFDPQQVFQDPEYAAQMRAGTEAMQAGAQHGGHSFSGRTDRDMTRFGQDVFTGRSNDLWGRGFAAQNTAFDQNLRGRGQEFDMGMGLSQPGFGAANNLSNLSVGRGNALAGNDIDHANVEAQRQQNRYGILGNAAGQGGSAAADYWAGKQASSPMDWLGKIKGKLGI